MTKDGVPRSHSKNGNLLDDGTRLLNYDYKNRLISVADKASGNPVAQYFYFADNRRARKVVFGSPNVTTDFFYDGWQVCEERSSASGTTTWVYSPVYVDEPVQMLTAAGAFFLHQNARADVVAVTDASGAVVERRFYDDFGRSFDGAKQPVVGSSVGNPYGFQGRRLDPETGLLYFRNRYYDAGTGRFLQRDPVWDAGNFGGQYSFVGNGPVSGFDPLGTNNWGVGPDFPEKQRMEQGYGGGGLPKSKFHSGAKQQRMPVARPARSAPQQRMPVARPAGSRSRPVDAAKSGRKVKLSNPDAATGEAAALKTVKALKLAQPKGTTTILKSEGLSPCKVGRALETAQLQQQGLGKNSQVFRPTPQMRQDPAFEQIVGKPKFTKTGLAKGTIPEAITPTRLVEIKGGSSKLGSSYQLRLQMYQAKASGKTYTLQTNRKLTKPLQGQILRVGGQVEPLK